MTGEKQFVIYWIPTPLYTLAHKSLMLVGDLLHFLLQSLLLVFMHPAFISRCNIWESIWPSTIQHLARCANSQGESWVKRRWMGQERCSSLTLLCLLRRMSYMSRQLLHSRPG